MVSGAQKCVPGSGRDVVGEMDDGLEEQRYGPSPPPQRARSSLTTLPISPARRYWPR